MLTSMFAGLRAFSQKSVAQTMAQSLAQPARGMKTHKGAAKRWWTNGEGAFVRKQAGRRHGNVGWSKGRVLRHLNGSVTAAPTQRHKKLRKLMPFA